MNPEVLERTVDRAALREALVRVLRGVLGKFDRPARRAVHEVPGVQTALLVLDPQYAFARQQGVGSAGEALAGRVRVPRVLTLALLAALVFPALASAHATLIRTSPNDGSVLQHAPTAVRAVFDDTVIRGPGIAAIRNGGGSVLEGKPRVEGGK